MPCVRIATGTWAEGSEMKLIEAVQSALVAAFKIPQSDRDVVLDLYGENRRIVATVARSVTPALRSSASRRVRWMPSGPCSKRFPTISKPRACRATRREIFLIEPPAESWGIKGGVLASEADIGFKIDV